MKAVVITAVRDVLISNHYESEEDLLKARPWVRNWERATFDSRHIRYHSRRAIAYWKKRKPNDKIVSREFYHY